MNDQGYATVGWLTITAGLLVLPMMGLSILLELPHRAVAVLLPIYVPLVVVQTSLALYALHRLKGLLNERFQFHEVDAYIPIIIVGVTAIAVVGIAGKVASALGMMDLPEVIALLALIALIGIPLSIVGIIFVLKLLHLNDELHGLLKPFVVLTLAANVCFATLLLAPVGALLDAAATVVLGVIFLRTSRGEPDVEFV